MPEGRYKFAHVTEPMLKTIIRPSVSIKMFSGMRSVLIREAVPYFEAALLEIMLKEEQIVSQVEKESSTMLISCKWRTSRLFLIRKDSICTCFALVSPVCPQMVGGQPWEI